MPRTIDEGFRDFLPKLTPSTFEAEAAKKHRASIEACLKANFDVMRFFRTGSFGNGTSISGYSDVDYFASIPTRKLKQNSALSLREVSAALNARFVSTNVKVSCPAVVAPFGLLSRETTEIVPAEYIFKTDGDFHVYNIPDCSGGWMHASPELHNAYVRMIDKKHSGKVKPLIRYVKAWKYYRNVPISSFYLEMAVTSYADNEETIIYDIDVENILRQLLNSKLAPINDPMGVSGQISPCSTLAQHGDALSKLQTAVTRAENARSAAYKENIRDAFYWWGLVYDGEFPGYYR